ncbi:MAG: hypothetical protein COS84_09240 [Armatimonadetes bacterium CG07_land_8_20_14_0_80_40_9]|nr:MAG: hypothetical protein COS84_09240 [Armatimonadetes bacterium CG07_land_8_20_14_0_80_40_9]
MESLGLKDSKELTPQRREGFISPINNIATKVIVKKIPPRRIDQENINLIELKVAVEIIQETIPDVVYLDVPTHPRGIKNYIKSLKYLLSCELSGVRPRGVGRDDPSGRLYGGSDPVIIGENKADKKYPLVSAASIVAKVERDKILKEIKEKYGDLGSGYPSDKKTIAFLRRVKEEGKTPSIVRKKWKVKI